MYAITSSRSALAMLAALSAVLTPTSTLDIAAQPRGFVARVTSVVVWRVDEAEFGTLTPNDRASLEKRRVRILDAERLLQSPELPLSGYWLEFPDFGEKRYRTDRDGYIRLSTKPTVTKEIKVFADAVDKTPFGVLATITFVPEGETPPADREEAERAGSRAPCPSPAPAHPASIAVVARSPSSLRPIARDHTPMAQRPAIRGHARPLLGAIADHSAVLAVSRVVDALPSLRVLE